MEFASKGIKLEVCETENGTYKELYGLYSVPDLGKEPDQVDVTNLADGAERKISSGVKTYDALAFDFYHNVKQSGEDETEKVLESYKYLRQKQDADAKLWFKLTYPDGGSHKWQGSPSAWKLSAGVKEALKFRLSTTVENGMTETFGSIAAVSSPTPAASGSDPE